MDILEVIKSRRSVRSYTLRKLDRRAIEQIIDAGMWAPSGNNLQPWKYVVITNEELILRVAELTVYNSWVKTAPCLIAVYYDESKKDDKIFDVAIKHYQAIGATIQNMLLAAQTLGIGSCWIGEILKKQTEVNGLLCAGSPLRLMAVVAFGYPDRMPKSQRVSSAEVILRWYE